MSGLMSLALADLFGKVELALSLARLLDLTGARRGEWLQTMKLNKLYSSLLAQSNSSPPLSLLDALHALSV